MLKTVASSEEEYEHLNNSFQKYAHMAIKTEEIAVWNNGFSQNSVVMRDSVLVAMRLD